MRASGTGRAGLFWVLVLVVALIAGAATWVFAPGPSRPRVQAAPTPDLLVVPDRSRRGAPIGEAQTA